MKRKGRKSKNSIGNLENGENSQPEDNNSLTVEPEEKKRKGSNRQKKASLATENNSNNTEAETTNPEESAQYEVESVLDEKIISGVRHYLIRWKGYEPESDTWEPESTLNCAELIAEFRAKAKKKKKGGKTSMGKKVNRKSSKQQSEWDENENFEVERILDVYFKRNGKREFLVSWKGYPQSQNSWEPEENMNCPELISKFMSKVEKAKETEQRELRVTRPHTDRFTLEMGKGHGRRLSKRNEGKQRIHYHDAE